MQQVKGACSSLWTAALYPQCSTEHFPACIVIRIALLPQWQFAHVKTQSTQGKARFLFPQFAAPENNSIAAHFKWGENYFEVGWAKWRQHTVLMWTVYQIKPWGMSFKTTAKDAITAFCRRRFFYWDCMYAKHDFIKCKLQHVPGWTSLLIVEQNWLIQEQTSNQPIRFVGQVHSLFQV